MENRIHDLLIRYIDKTITDAEYQELSLIVRDLKYNELAQHLSSTWDKFEIAEDVDDEILKEIKNNIDRKLNYPQKRISLLTYFSRIASILLIPVIMVATYLFFSQSPQQISSYYTEPTIVETAKGQQVKLILPDGTKVDLNSESTLKYYSDFSSDNRVVYLDGEGFFDVTKDEAEKNFVIKNQYIDIEVLGTSFNVNTNNSTFSSREKNMHLIEIALLTGSIRAHTKGMSPQVIELKPNQKLVLNKQTGETEIKPFDLYQETAWTKGLMVFRSSPLAEVFAKLERKFGVMIVIDNPKLEDDLLTGTFKAGTIVEIMDILSVHYQFDYKISDDTLTIKTK